MMKGKKVYSKLSILIIIILLILGTQVLAASLAKVMGVKATPSSTAVVVTWNKVSGATNYEVEINIPGIGFVPQPKTTSMAKTITGLEPGKTYQVKVRAIKGSVVGPYSNVISFTTSGGSSNSGGNSSWGGSHSGSTSVGTVSGVRANPSSTAVTVSWNRLSGATAYEVAINIPGIGYVPQRQTTGTYQTITGLEAGKTYAVKVRAIGNGRYGSYSNEVRFTTTGGSSNNNSNNNGGNSSSSGNSTLDGRITDLSVSNVGNTTAYIQWSWYVRATGYEIYLRSAGGSYEKLGTTDRDTIRIRLESLNPGTTYYAKIRPIRTENGSTIYGNYSNEVVFTTTGGSSNSGGNSSWGGSHSGNTSVGTVSGVRANPSGTAVTVSWNRLSGATAYEVAINIPGIGYVPQRQTTGTSQTITGLDAGKTYAVKVRAIGNGRYGEYSSEVRFTTTGGNSNNNNGGNSSGGNTSQSLGKVMNLRQTGITENSVTFAYNAVANATGYEIYAKVGNGSYTYVGKLSSNQVELNGLTAGTTYYIKVRAYNSVGYGDYSSELRVTTPISGSANNITQNNTTQNNTTGGNSNQSLGKVMNLRQTSITENSVTFAYNAVANATGYEIYAKVGNGSYTYVGKISSNQVELNGLTAGTTYYIKVRAYNSAGYGDYSSELRVTTPTSQIPIVIGQATNLRVIRLEENFVTFAYDKGTNATNYEIFVRTANTAYISVGKISSTQVQLAGLTAGTTYYIKVKSYNGTESGPESGELQFTTPISSSTTGGNSNNNNNNNGGNTNQSLGKVMNLRQTGITENSVTFAYNAVANATGYEIYAKVGNGSYTYVGKISSNQVELNGLTAGTTYYIKVRAYNGTGYGDYSSELRVTTPISSSTTGGNSNNNNNNNNGGNNAGGSSNQKPGRVMNLRTISVQENFVAFTYNTVANATGYEIYIRTANGGYSYAGSVPTNQVQFNTLAAGTTYYVKVRAYNAAGYGEYSSELKFTTPISSSTTWGGNHGGSTNNNGGNNSGGSSNQKPQQVTGVRATGAETSVLINWDSATNATAYEVAIYIPGVGYVEQTPTTARSHIVSHLEEGTTYKVKVRAINGNVYGEYSREISVTTKGQKSGGAASSTNSIMAE